jgi:hypothetical protein
MVAAIILEQPIEIPRISAFPAPTAVWGHSCGFHLRKPRLHLRLIQDYLGHRDPKHTVHDTCVAGSRFEGLWR